MSGFRDSRLQPVLLSLVAGWALYILQENQCSRPASKDGDASKANHVPGRNWEERDRRPPPAPFQRLRRRALFLVAVPSPTTYPIPFGPSKSTYHFLLPRCGHPPVFRPAKSSPHASFIQRRRSHIIPLAASTPFSLPPSSSTMFSSLPIPLLLSLLLSTRLTSARPRRFNVAQQQAIPNPNDSWSDPVLPVIVHVVDPSSPSQSIQPPQPSIHLTFADDDQLDEPNFGASCQFVNTFMTCGDYFDKTTAVDHGLFCSPVGVCAGKGAACGSSEACGEGALPREQGTKQGPELTECVCRAVVQFCDTSLRRIVVASSVGAGHAPRGTQEGGAFELSARERSLPVGNGRVPGECGWTSKGRRRS
jgi:hypothetical protein